MLEGHLAKAWINTATAGLEIGSSELTWRAQPNPDYFFQQSKVAGPHDHNEFMRIHVAGRTQL